MQIIHHLTIDLARQLPVPPISAVQNDANTRVVEVSLLENGAAWEVPEGVTAAVAFRKPDRHKGLYDQLPDGTAAVAVNGSAVLAILAPQVLTCAGDTYAAVVFHDADLNQLATFPFTLRVAANPAAGQTVSNDYYRYSTMEEVSEAVEAALAALEQDKQDFLNQTSAAQASFLEKAEQALAVVHDTATEDAPAIVCEASGSVVAVSDAAERPLKGLTLYGKTIQEGTPTPENPVPLETVGASGAVCVAVAGKNLVQPGESQVVNGITKIVNPDGSFTLKGTATADIWLRTDFYATAGAPHILSGCPGTGATNTYTQYVSENGIFYWDFGEGVTFTPLTNGLWPVYTLIRSGVTMDATFCQMVRLADTDAAFEAPKAIQTLTASTGDGLHGTGGVTDEIDLARGVRVKRFDIKVFDGSADEPWNYANSYIDYPNDDTLYARIWTPLSNIGFAPWAAVLCDKLGSYSVRGVDHAPKHGAELWANLTNFHVVPGKDFLDSENNITTMRQWLADNPITVLYELAEPIETALTGEELAAYAALHSNKPNTTVINDSGAEMKLSYVADTRTYIDQKISAISAAILA